VLNVDGCVVRDNYATHNGGGGNAVVYASLNVSNTAFLGNSTGTYGAGVSCDSGYMVITECLFHGNFTGVVSGGLYYYRSSGIVRNNTFDGNPSPKWGSVVVQDSPGVAVDRNIISNATGGYGLVIIDCSIPHSCNLFWQDPKGPIYGDVLEPDESVADPLFCDPAAGDFTISHQSPATAVNSPCHQLIGAFDPVCSPPVPVFIQHFEASLRGMDVALSWQIATDDEILGFRLYRQIDPFESIDALNGGQLVPSDLQSYVDNSTEAGETYRYRMAVVLPNGSEVYSKSVEVTVPDNRDVLALRQNVPNPFNPSTRIPFSIREPGRVLLCVFDARGALVKNLLDERRPPVTT